MNPNTIQYLVPGFELKAKKLGYDNKTISNQINKLIDFSTSSIQNISPSVVEETKNGNLISYDIYTRLLKDRIIFLGHPIMDEVTNIVIAQLLFLEMDNEKKDITMYINSPGGSINSGLSLINTMDYIRPEIGVVAIGMAASMGAVILACGAKGKRYALRDTKIMIHSPSTEMRGKTEDLEVTFEELQKTKKRLYEILAEKSGQTFEQILAKSKLDYWMSSEEAKKEGFIDEVLIKRL